MIEDWFKKAQEKRFKSFQGYKLDRWLFQFGMYAIFFWMFFVAWSSGFDLNYFYCPENSDGSISGLKIMLKDYDLDGAVVNGSCRNPFYKDDWTTQQYLPPGEYGTKPGVLFNSVMWSPFVVFCLLFLFNHYFHNKDYDFEELRE